MTITKMYLTTYGKHVLYDELFPTMRLTTQCTVS
jgi:hypothetical protein